MNEKMKHKPLQPWPKPVAKVHDFGSYGMLTVMQASVISGRHEVTIYNRLKRGELKGEALLAKYVPKPPRKVYRKELNFSGPGPGIADAFFQGVKMHRIYGDNVPTAKQLVRDFGYGSTLR